MLTLDQADAGEKQPVIGQPLPPELTLLREVSGDEIIDFTHRENKFLDFERDRLIYHKLSTQGPRIAIGDVNGDGLDDLYIGGARDMAGVLFIQKKNGEFEKTNEQVFEADALSEDTDAAFFDADNDGDQDLYVASGGTEFPTSSPALRDRLYINDGNGNFKKMNQQILPAGKFESTSCVRPADFDNDGIVELFVGIRQHPFLYGVPVNGYILENDGHGKFTVEPRNQHWGLNELGMITDMQWTDIDGDKDLDMVIVGEYMPVVIFRNDHGEFTNITESAGLAGTNGWWNRVMAGDFDKDGDTDLVAGNHGWNSRFKATREKPVSMYVNDYDMNGSAEQIICVYNGDSSYPLALKHDLIRQIPFLEEKYPNYTDYMEQTISDIFNPEQLARAVSLEAYEMSTSLILNQGNGMFEVRPLPAPVQISPVYGILVEDIDRDGNLDILMGGNLFGVKPEVGRYDASYGTLLKGHGDGKFSVLPAQKSGIGFRKEIRDIITIQTARGKFVVAARNNEPLQLFEY
jgi:hypothetical protein